MNITKVFGPPGSGKTTFLLNIVEAELAGNVHPMKIGYFAFTKKAATEARDRAIQKFPNLNHETDFPFFRTLHSLAYRCLGISTKDMMSPEHYREFAQEAGIELAIEAGEEEFAVKVDNPILNEINIARIRGMDLKTHYNQSNMDIEWFHFEYVERAYRHYKTSRNLMDFTDLLEYVLLEPDRLPKLEALIIDEAQDLSRLQWRLVEQLALRAQRCFLAGDDDQAVYTWAGADVASFLGFTGDVKVLDQSYRVPAKIHALANQVVTRIKHRQPKVWKAREEVGSISYYNDFSQVDISSGNWLILASANYMLTNMHDWIKSQGLLFERHGQRSVSENILTAVLGWEKLRKGGEVTLPVVKMVYKYLDSAHIKHGHKMLRTADPAGMYSLFLLKEKHGLLSEEIWHKALTKISEDRRDYLISLLRRNTKLTGHVPIKLSTIHGAKGGEADNVLLLSDLSTRFAKDYNKNSDDINRLLYVGITRAKQTLHIVLPKNEQKGFRL
jgi:DNA helicase II / ATP-dependent DNA helicase PcrA